MKICHLICKMWMWEGVCACECVKISWVCLQFVHHSKEGCWASEEPSDGPEVTFVCCLWEFGNFLQNSTGYQEISIQTFLFLIQFINEMALRCTADVVFCDADEPFGAVQLIMSSGYCYKIGLPGNSHLRTQLTNSYSAEAESGSSETTGQILWFLVFIQGKPILISTAALTLEHRVWPLEINSYSKSVKPDCFVSNWSINNPYCTNNK